MPNAISPGAINNATHVTSEETNTPHQVSSMSKNMVSVSNDCSNHESGKRYKQGMPKFLSDIFSGAIRPEKNIQEVSAPVLDTAKQLMKADSLLMRVMDVFNTANFDPSLGLYSNNAVKKSGLVACINQLRNLKKNIGRSCSLIMEHAPVQPYSNSGYPTCGILFSKPDKIEAVADHDINTNRDDNGELSADDKSKNRTLKELSDRYKNNEVKDPSAVNEVVAVIEHKNILSLFIYGDNSTTLARVVAAQNYLATEYGYELPVIRYQTDDTNGTSSVSFVTKKEVSEIAWDPDCRDYLGREEISKLITGFKEYTAPPKEFKLPD